MQPSNLLIVSPMVITVDFRIVNLHQNQDSVKWPNVC